jgi:succinate dehydrogenase/fumarate reductase flavoprotein subunit
MAYVRHGSRALTGSGTCTMPSITCAEKRREPSASSKNTGCHSVGTEDGLLYQRPLGGHGLDYGTGGQAYRTACAADRTGHSMLHTPYGQALKHDCQFHIEWFALDLMMQDKKCIGTTALDTETGTLHWLSARNTILATGGYRRAYFSATSAHTSTGDGLAMASRAGLPLQDMGVCAIPPKRHIWSRSSNIGGRPRGG